MKPIRIATRSLLLIILVVLLLPGCSGGGKKEKSDLETLSNEVSEEEKKKENLKKVKRIVHTLPTPVEVASIFRRTGVEFHKDLLFPVEHVDHIESRDRKAFCLGLYAADLSYVAVFERTGEVLKYMSATKDMGEKLGITKVLDKDLLERVDQNIENKDSLLYYVGEVYERIEAYLEKNEQKEIAAWSMAGAWVEGIYLGSKLAQRAENNQEIVKRIGEQKLVLDDLIDLIENLDESQSTKDLREALSGVEKAFWAVEIEYSKGRTETDTSERTTTLGGSTKVSIEEGVPENIRRELRDLRQRYTGKEFEKAQKTEISADTGTTE